jgi:hypothetical protein
MFEIAFEANGRECVHEIESRLRDHPALVRPAAEVFRAVYAPNLGSDHAFRVEVCEDSVLESLVVSVRAVVPVAQLVEANREVVAVSEEVA